jgi:hypothetical protein
MLIVSATPFAPCQPPRPRWRTASPQRRAMINPTDQHASGNHGHEEDELLLGAGLLTSPARRRSPDLAKTPDRRSPKLKFPRRTGRPSVDVRAGSGDPRTAGTFGRMCVRGKETRAQQAALVGRPAHSSAEIFLTPCCLMLRSVRSRAGSNLPLFVRHQRHVTSGSSDST